MLEWVVISFCRRSSQPRDWTHVSCIGRQVLDHGAIWETLPIGSTAQPGSLRATLSLRPRVSVQSNPVTLMLCLPEVKRQKKDVWGTAGAGPLLQGSSLFSSLLVTAHTDFLSAHISLSVPESPLSLEFLLLFLESGRLHFFPPYPPLWVSEYLMVVNEPIFTTSPETSVFGVTDQRIYYWHRRKPANWPSPHRRQVLFSSCLRFWLAVWPLFPHPVIVSALQECCGVQQMLRTVPLKGGKVGVRCAIPGNSKRVRVI